MYFFTRNSAVKHDYIKKAEIKQLDGFSRGKCHDGLKVQCVTFSDI